jgi:hypothetical protein
MVIGVIFAIVGPLLVICLVGAAIVALVKGKLTMAMLAHAYTAIVLGIGLILILAGGAYLLKAGLSELIGRDFSYTTTRPAYAGEYYESAQTALKNDIVLGITLVTIGAIVGTIHAFGKHLAARRNQAHAAIIERVYDLAMLFVGTAVGLTSVIVLLNDLLKRYVVTDAARPIEQLPHPGSPLAVAVFFVPLWIIFGVRVWRNLNAPPTITTPVTGQLTPATTH